MLYKKVIHEFIHPTHLSSPYYAPKHKGDPNGTILTLMELARTPRGAGETDINHMNKCRIATVVKGKDAGLHCKMRAWKREF